MGEIGLALFRDGSFTRRGATTLTGLLPLTIPCIVYVICVASLSSSGLTCLAVHGMWLGMLGLRHFFSPTVHASGFVKHVKLCRWTCSKRSIMAIVVLDFPNRG